MNRVAISIGIWGLSLVAALPVGAAPPMFGYTVQRGDTLYALAQAYFTHPGDYRTVRRANHISNPRRLPAGMELEVPIELLRTRPILAHLLAFRGDVTIGPESRAPPSARAQTPTPSSSCRTARAYRCRPNRVCASSGFVSR
jgi:hypothetical protein